MNHRKSFSAAFAVLVLAAAPLAALVQPGDSPINDRAFRHDQLDVVDRYEPASAVAPESSPAVRNLAALGASPESSRLDLRTGRWGTLMPATPLLPGTGVGNDLTWQDVGARAVTAAGLKEMAWSAFVDYLQGHQSSLLVDVAELAGPGRVTVHDDGALIQIYAPRSIDGVPVRNSYLAASLRYGNLVLFAARNWGDVRTSAEPAISQAAAETVLTDHLYPLLPIGWRKAGLVFVPMAAAGEAVGEGIEYRLAWALQPKFADDRGTWEALVDAHSGELLAFEDQNQYATARVVEGGVFPISNNGVGPEGTEQPDFPMPFADVVNAGDLLFTDNGGNVPACLDGSITTSLNGTFVRMNDFCGAITDSTAGNTLDLGTSGGSNCTVPAGGSSGNTHASRSGYYELNRIIAQARGQLPDNEWLQEKLISNMNINDNCNAFWSGTAVNFYRSGGPCANTGELAGVFDHEWGHGMDDNDALPTIANPGEGIADIYAYLRLDTSCIGPGFLLGSNCGGYGDPCTQCDGVRDIDWAKRASGTPHDIDFVDACPPPPQGPGGPCGGVVHCEGAAYSEALYDLVNRDLPCFGIGWENVGGGQCIGGAAETIDHNTALEIATRMAYLGAGMVGNWFQCTTPFGGCNGDGGYLNFLVADDDNGMLSDGTPHMEEIFDAFNRHQIACNTPTVTNSGCAGTPTSEPMNVVATALDRGVRLTWDAVAGASSYKVYRTDGVRDCDFGKILLGETTDLELVDKGLKNGHESYYVVIPFGPHEACFGPASACTPVTPSPGVNLTVGLQPELVMLSGDGDAVLDNCEQARIQLPVYNFGTGALTNVTIVDVEAVDHPEIVILSPLPRLAANFLPACADNLTAIDIQADGLSLNDRVVFRIDFTSDELSPEIRSELVQVALATESDFQFSGTRTFTFESDLEGWQVGSGTFSRVTDPGNAGGAPASDTYVASSANLGNQCDHIQSPILMLQSNSTLSLWTNFDIEPFCAQCTPPSWYDRANVGVYDVLHERRTPIDPSAGRAYNASGLNGTCGTETENGWAGTMATWASSTFNAAALRTDLFAGDFVQLDVRYGTDPMLHPEGFWFDEVRVTNVNVQTGADAQSDVCPAAVGMIFTDGFESGNTSAWDFASP